MFNLRELRRDLRFVVAGSGLLLSVAAFGGDVSAQSANYDPQQGAPTRYQAPHEGFLNGKFWTDTRYRYEYVDQANKPKNARASTIRNKTGVESGFFHGFRAGIEGTISGLKRAFRLARCYFRTFKSFQASIGLGVFCHNLVVLSKLPDG